MLATKSPTRKTSENKPVDIKLAEEGHILASLLRQKILAQVEPEVKEMFLVHDKLSCIWSQVAPSDYERIPGTTANHENLVKGINDAERILTRVSRV
jgi:hypothetical protein